MPQPSISIGWGRGTSLLPISILRGFWWINLEAGTCNHYIIRPRVGPAGRFRDRTGALKINKINVNSGGRGW